MNKAMLVELESGVYKNPLLQCHRDAMLDLILTWGTLDGALLLMVTSFTVEPLHEVADQIGRSRGSHKFQQIIDMLKSDENTAELAANFKRLKRKYEKYSRVRNRIAHGHCAGYLPSDHNYLVFSICEREGDTNMAVDATPLDEIEEATRFGRTMIQLAMKIVEKRATTGIDTS